MQKDLCGEIINFMMQFCMIANGFSNNVVGLGACSWHSVGQELLRAYKNGDQKIIDFVNNDILKSYAEKYKDKIPEFADFKNYPMEVLEFNEFPNAEFYKAYLMFFEGDHNQNHNRFPSFISDILKNYSLDKRIDDDEKDNKKYEAYKKYIFDLIFNFGDNYLEINIDYDKLFKIIDKLNEDKSPDYETKYSTMGKINDIISSSLESNLINTKIDYNFNNNWLLKDQDGYRINQDLLKNSWQFYRVGNILGQAFREHLYDLKKDREQSKKSGSKSDKDNLNKIIDELPDIKKLEKPFKGQKYDDTNNYLALIAQKTEKSSIAFGFEKRDETIDKDKDKIDTDKYCLDLIDGKTGTVKCYQIKFIGDEVHIYDTKNIPVIKLSDEESGKRLLGTEVKDLLNQIEKIKKTNPFCFIRRPGHIEILNHDKEDKFFNRIDKALEFIAANERSKTKDTFCRIGKFFEVLVTIIGFCFMIATVIPIIILLVDFISKCVQKNQKEKLSQTQTRSSYIERVVQEKVITKKLEEYIGKTEEVYGNGNGNGKGNQNSKPLSSLTQELSMRSAR